MDFGTFHLFESIGRTESEAVDEQIELMVAAEDLGFSSVWAAEHHFSEYGVCPSAVLALAAVAKLTTTIRLGTGIVVLPFHNPIRAAEELAFVDLLSHGRLEVGVGRGYRPKELAGFGIDPAESRAIANESLEIIRQAWTQDEVNFRGSHFTVEGYSVSPKPMQRPHPRLYLGSLSPETFQLVGRLDVNLLFTPTFGPGENIPAQLEQYRSAVVATGGDLQDKRIGALRMVYVADTTEQAKTEFEQARRAFGEVAHAQNQPRAHDPVAPYQERYTSRAAPSSIDDAQAAGNVIAGDPDHVLRQLERMQEAWGLTDLILWTRVGGLSSDRVLHSLELFSQHVMPHLGSGSSDQRMGRPALSPTEIGTRAP